MKKISYIILAMASMILSSCSGEFWEGVAMGSASLLGGMASGYSASCPSSSAFGWNVYNVPSPSSTVNRNSGTVYAGSVSTGSTSSSSKSSSSTTTRHQCSLCHGSGSYIRESYVATYGLDSKKYCDICKSSYMASSGHSHVTCPQCHGKGYN